jgi:hypothetical protein
VWHHQAPEDRLRLNIVPMWHALRLAEDYAMADILTGGRVIFGVGRGCHTREVETFGSPLMDQDANREIFEEGVEVLFKAFESKPFSHKGKSTRSRGRCRTAGTRSRRSRWWRRAGAATDRMLATDPERLRSRLRLYCEVRHPRRDRRRLSRGGAIAPARGIDNTPLP